MLGSINIPRAKIIQFQPQTLPISHPFILNPSLKHTPNLERCIFLQKFDDVLLGYSIRVELFVSITSCGFLSRHLDSSHLTSLPQGAQFR